MSKRGRGGGRGRGRGGGRGRGRGAGQEIFFSSGGARVKFNFR